MRPGRLRGARAHIGHPIDHGDVILPGVEIVSLGPFSASVLLWEPRPGDLHLTVCATATMSIVPGGQATLMEPRGGAPDDGAPFKPRADILLVGHACAPGAAPVESLLVRLAVGRFSKSLRVWGDRAWTALPGGLQPGPPRPFTSMPLHYERAAMRGDNLSGVSPTDRAPGRPLPNIDMADESVAEGTPGFGPIPPRWRALRYQLPADAAAWAWNVRGAGPARPAPAGLTYDYFNAAPRDQQVDWLGDGLPILIENMHPRTPRIETRLPPVHPKVFHIDAASGWPAEVQLSCDTLLIDADSSTVVVTWRGFARASGPVESAAGKIIVAPETTGEQVSYEDVARLAWEQARGGAHAAPTPIHTTQATADSNDFDGTVRMTSPHTPQAAPLPFKPAPAPPAFDGTIQIKDARPPAGAPLPFRPGAPSPEVSTPGARSPRDALRRQPAPTDSSFQGDSTLPIARPHPARDPLPFVSEDQVSRGYRAPPLPPPLPPPPPPPPLPPSSPAAARVSPADVSIERCATIAAALAMKPSDREPILEEHGLTRQDWGNVERRWSAAIRKEGDRGKTALLTAYDEAYVAELERGRGPIEAAEYAGLMVAMERGSVDRALYELRLPRDTQMRIQRVVMNRMTTDKLFAASVREALAAARGA